jgi:IclR family pca regulon transcriptional regulator
MNPAEPPVATAPAPPAPRPGDTYVQSFARGLSVLRSFGADAPAQTLSEVAQRTGLTRAGARRILLTLQGLGYVESRGRQFRLTARTLELGFAYLSSLPLWNLAEPVVETLATAAGGRCAAAVLDGDEIVEVLQVSAAGLARTMPGSSSRLPAFCTASGRVLLASLSPAECRARLDAAPRRAFTTRTLTAVDRLDDAIALARRQRWCLVDGEFHEGALALAAPVVDRSDRTIAALEVGGDAGRYTAAQMQEQVLAPLCEAAARLSELVRMKS